MVPRRRSQIRIQGNEAVAPVVLVALGAAGFGSVEEESDCIDGRVARAVRGVLDLADCVCFAGFVTYLLHQVGDGNFSLLLWEAWDYGSNFRSQRRPSVWKSS